MTKVDLVTGFLGSGKTTFIKEYAKYLLSTGERICILVNDYGAINVDMMYYSEMECDELHLEMVAGGCDSDCHKRRFKTKLIALGMQGFNRIIVEPSGLFDMDEFFDCLYEPPLDDWYEIGNIITMLDADMDMPVSKSSEVCLCSELSNAGIVVLSKVDNKSSEEIYRLIDYVNGLLASYKCERDIKNFSIIKKREDFSLSDFAMIAQSGYKRYDYIKFNVDESDFRSLYYMDKKLSKDEVIIIANKLFDDIKHGNVIRVKGFTKDNEFWNEINITKNSIKVEPIKDGQDVLIVIGENIDEEEIGSYFTK